MNRSVGNSEILYKQVHWQMQDVDNILGRLDRWDKLKEKFTFWNRLHVPPVFSSCSLFLPFPWQQAGDFFSQHPLSSIDKKNKKYHFPLQLTTLVLNGRRWAPPIVHLQALQLANSQPVWKVQAECLSYRLVFRRLELHPCLIHQSQVLCFPGFLDKK